MRLCGEIAGLCRAERAALSLENYDPTSHNLTLHGKRNKTRVVPIEDAGALADWLYLLFNETCSAGVLLYSSHA